MASLTGSFPAFRRPLLRRLLFAFGCVLATATLASAMPDYVRDAFAKFNPEAPKGWAYTLTTVRNNEARTTARFDPARPPAAQWTLLDLNGQPPTASEAAQFAQASAGSTPQSSFQKADIEPASFVLVKEDADRGEFKCTFRTAAAEADKMLGHLTLLLTVNKRQPHVEKFSLSLNEPYSPVLGVKMRELLVQMSFTAPGADRPSLPVTSTSHFLGRIFFIGTEENLVLTYSDFVRTK
jgi:hypothetical protein